MTATDGPAEARPDDQPAGRLVGRIGVHPELGVGTPGDSSTDGRATLRAEREVGP